MDAMACLKLEKYMSFSCAIKQTEDFLLQVVRDLPARFKTLVPITH